MAHKLKFSFKPLKQVTYRKKQQQLWTLFVFTALIMANWLSLAPWLKVEDMMRKYKKHGDPDKNIALYVTILRHIHRHKADYIELTDIA